MQKLKIKTIGYEIDFLNTKSKDGTIVKYPYQVKNIYSFDPKKKRGVFEIKYQHRVAIKVLTTNPKDQQGYRKDTETSYIVMREPSANIINIYHIQQIPKQGNMQKKAFIIMQKGKHTLNDAQDEINDNKLKYIGHVASGLAHLHKCGIVHRDIKAENVLITWGNIAKIFDFGASKYYGELKQGQSLVYQIQSDKNQEKKMINTVDAIGTQIFNPPEIGLTTVQTKVIGSSDMWQFGLLIAQFIWDIQDALSHTFKSHCQENLENWKSNPNSQLKFQIPKFKRLNFQGEEKLIQLTQRCLYYHPDKRIRSEDFVKQFYNDVFKNTKIDLVKRESMEQIETKTNKYQKPKNVSDSEMQKQILKNFISKSIKELSQEPNKQQRAIKLQSLKSEAFNMYAEKGTELVKKLQSLLHKS